jgi:lysophospholipase L1-like esterase
MKPAKNFVSLCALLAFILLPAAPARAQQPIGHVWIGTWATSQQIPEPQHTLPPAALTNATLRQIVHVSVGGDVIRIHLSNAFGRWPLLFSSVHVARAVAPGSSAIVPGTDRVVTFSGSPQVIVPTGADYISDPIHLSVKPLSNLAITFYFRNPPARETGHPGSRSTSYYLSGDHVSDPSLPTASKVNHWYQLSGVDVEAPTGAASIVALGDSITDGHATTTNGNNRWTDDLAARLQANPATRDIGVLNEGIGGNHLLTDGLGPNTLARFDRDVLAQPGVRWVIVFEGVNDLGGLTIRGPVPAAAHQLLVHRIIAAYQQIIQRAHEHGIRVIGATITPYQGNGYYHPGAASLQDRNEINAWIRAPGHFDAVIDFAKAIRDPSNHERLNPIWDCGDHLHPNPTGYHILADSIPLSLFAH